MPCSTKDPSKRKALFRRRNVKNKTDRRQWLRQIMVYRGCAHCGIKDHRVLDWAHLPGTIKTMNVSRLVSSKSRMVEEMEKCIVLCANCHRIFDYRG